MKKRIVIIGLLLCVAVGVGAVVYWELTPTPGVTVENFRRLHKGMSRAEVETILGRERNEPGSREKYSELVEILWPTRWIGNGCKIEISFAPDGLVYTFDSSRPPDHSSSGYCYCDGSPRLELAEQPLPLLDKIRVWLGI